VLVVPFPRDIVDARDVQLQVRPTSTRVVPARGRPLLDVMYDKSGIHATCLLNRGEILALISRLQRLGASNLIMLCLPRESCVLLTSRLT
jgi:hypothetical protein